MLTPQMCRAEIGSVGDGKSLEDTPRKSLDNAAGKKHGKTGAEERDEDSTGHDHHADDHGPFVPQPLGDVAIDDETNDAADLAEATISRARKQLYLWG